MELSKQGQPNVPTSMGSQQLPSSTNQSSEAGLPMFYSHMALNWGNPQFLPPGAGVPFNPYYLMHMNERPVQVQSSCVETPHLVGSQSLGSTSRVSLRPQQMLNIHTSMPMAIGSQPSPSTGKKLMPQPAASPKVQMLKSGPTQCGNKRPAPKEPPAKVNSEAFESVRSKFRESLAAALSVDSNQKSTKQSAEKGLGGESVSEDKQTEGTSSKEVVSTSANATSNSLETLSSLQEKKSDESEKVTIDKSMDDKESLSNDIQQLQSSFSSEKVVPTDSMIVADELLQGHGLCWASDFDAGVTESVMEPDSKADVASGIAESLREPDLKKLKTAHEATEDKKEKEQKAEILAFRIEAELFKLFGGVNKKYKEKARSLLFNLKDKSNPELRERVLSGDITPERLCSMTAEELASKELSEWRLAKAEELAQMVMLPDTEVDVRRLVKKTHKGEFQVEEFQVEAEQTDGISAEVELGTSIISQVPSRGRGGSQTKSNDEANPVSKPEEPKESEGMLDENAESDNPNLSNNLEELLNDKTDFMQEFMVDELKDTENLPPIVSLDEFMEALDSEPPFEDLTADDLQDNPTSGGEAAEGLESEKVSEAGGTSKVPDSDDGLETNTSPPEENCQPKLESPEDVPDSNLDDATHLEKDTGIKPSPDKLDENNLNADNGLKSEPVDDQLKTSFSDVTLGSEGMWEGVIQFSLSSLANVVAIYKSGQKPSTKEWSSLVEIKGRVRLGHFEEFLQELPKSKSRVLMIAEVRWKEGSLESGGQNLLQTIDSYIADERVGIAYPAPEAELYLCPPRGKIVEMLARVLPKEHSKSLGVTGIAAIGVVVWRRPNVSSRTPSHHRHSGSKKQSNPRKQQVMSSNPVSRSSMPLSSLSTPPGFPNPRHEDDVSDDVPPGFGPGVVAKIEDDLPEFDFNNNRAASVTAQAYKGRADVYSSARPVEQVRELIHKYGKRSTVDVQTWNDDDDIPEWNPSQYKQPQMQPQQLQTQLPPPPPLSHLHSYQQPQQHSVQQPLQANNYASQMQNTYYPSQQLLQTATQLPLQSAPHVQQVWQPNHSNSGWQQAGAMPATGLTQQSYYGVQSNTGNSAGMSWRPDGRGV